MFPAGLAIMLFRSPYLWTTSIFLLLQASILFITLYKSIGIVKTIAVSFIVLWFSFAVEYIGVNTSFPFGKYLYSETLQPLTAGVPLAIAFAWFSVMVSSYLTAVNLFPGIGTISVCFISSVIVFATDIMLEPFASFVNGFWLWDGGTIPLQNFICWWVLGFLLSFVLSLFAPPSKVNIADSLLKKIPYVIIIINVLNFMIINTISGYLLISLAGFIVIISIMLILPKFIKHEA